MGQKEEREAAPSRLSAVVQRGLQFCVSTAAAGTPLAPAVSATPSHGPKGFRNTVPSLHFIRPGVVLTPLVASFWTLHPPFLGPKTMSLSNSFIKFSWNKVSLLQVPSVSCYPV